jgi:hypothetical protein
MRKGSRLRRKALSLVLGSALVVPLLIFGLASASYTTCAQEAETSFTLGLGTLLKALPPVPVGSNCATPPTPCLTYDGHVPLYCWVTAVGTARARIGIAGVTVILQRRTVYKVLGLYRNGDWTNLYSGSCQSGTKISKGASCTEYVPLIEGYDPSLSSKLVHHYEYRAVCDWKSPIGSISRNTRVDCTIDAFPYGDA